MEPLLASFVAVLLFLASHGIAFAADAAGIAEAPLPLEWNGWIERIGTVGVLIWMVVWFQKRNDKQQEQLQQITERALTAVERGAESDRALAAAIDRWRDRMESH